MNHLNSLQGGKRWLGTTGDDSLFTLTLLNATNPLDADAIWDNVSPSDGNESIIDQVTGKSSHRLQRALIDHAIVSSVIENGIPLEASAHFSDVVIWIDSMIWNQDARGGGHRLSLMAEKLIFLHQKSFTVDSSYQHREAHYVVMPRDDLPENTVICQFGSGVFVPDIEEQPEADIRLSSRGQEAGTPPDWVFFKRKVHGKPSDGVMSLPERVIKPAGLYKQQQILLLGGKIESSALISPVWLKDCPLGQIHLLFNSEQEQPQVNGDGRFLKRTDSRNTQTSMEVMTFRFHSVKKPKDRITLELYRKTASNPYAELLKKKQSSARLTSSGYTFIDPSLALSGLTHMDSSESALGGHYALKLTGIVLPKLDHYQETDHGEEVPNPPLHWQLYMDETGYPTTKKDNVAWLLRGDAGSDNLRWKLVHEDIWQPVLIDQPLPFPKDYDLYLDPAHLKSQQFAILPVTTEALILPLYKSERPLLLGRSTEGTDATAPTTYTLHLLNKAGHFTLKDRKTLENPDYLGLSSSHLYLQLFDDQLQIEQLNSQTFILDSQGVVKRTLDKQSPFATLYRNQSICVGLYRFRFVNHHIPENRLQLPSKP